MFRKRSPKEEDALSSIFPIGLLQSPELVTDDTIDVKLKYTFAMETDQFAKELEPLFAKDGEEEIFNEEFTDGENYELMQASVWAKLTTPSTRQYHSTISFKYVELKQVESSNYIIYNEYKIHPSDTIQFGLASILLMMSPIKIALSVNRQRYTLRKNEKIKLTWDRVQFVETGDDYSVFAIFADVPKGQLDKLINDEPREETMQIITKTALSSRSKIIEYLYRYKRDVYFKLVEKGLIIDHNVDEKWNCDEEGWNYDQDISELKDGWGTEASNLVFSDGTESFKLMYERDRDLNTQIHPCTICTNLRCS